MRCPICGLSFTRREDGLCPRCSALSLGAKDAARFKPPHGLSASMSRVLDEDVPAGARVAGAVFILNAAVLGVERLVVPVSHGAMPVAASIVTALVDLLIGAQLVRGHGRFVAWARIRAVLGAIIFPLVYAGSGESLLALVQLGFSAALLLLLFGHPRQVRLGLASALIGAYFVFAIASLTGSGILSKTLLSMKGDIDPVPVVDVRGEKFDWRFMAPSPGEWYQRKSETAKKDNPLADRWIVRPEGGANAIVVAETTPGSSGLDVDAFAGAVQRNAESTLERFQVLERRPLESRITARLLHATALEKGSEIEMYYGLFVEGQTTFQVVTFAERRNFPAVSAELMRIIESFRPGPPFVRASGRGD